MKTALLVLLVGFGAFAKPIYLEGCEATYVSDTYNPFEEGFSVNEYPGVNVWREDDKLFADIGAQTAFGNDKKDVVKITKSTRREASYFMRFGDGKESYVLVVDKSRRGGNKGSLLIKEDDDSKYRLLAKVSCGKR